MFIVDLPRLDLETLEIFRLDYRNRKTILLIFLLLLPKDKVKSALQYFENKYKKTSIF